MEIFHLPGIPGGQNRCRRWSQGVENMTKVTFNSRYPYGQADSWQIVPNGIKREGYDKKSSEIRLARAKSVWGARILLPGRPFLKTFAASWRKPVRLSPFSFIFSPRLDRFRACPLYMGRVDALAAARRMEF